MKLIGLAALLAIAMPASAMNVVTNGDFSAGNTGFTSDYGYRAPGNYGSALEAGLYAVDTSAFNTHPAWIDFADHTGDAAGLYLIANGSGQEDATLWEQSVTVTPGTNYRFSAWVSDVCCNSSAPGALGFPPSFTFIVLDDAAETVTTIGSFVPGEPGGWFEVGANYFSGTATLLRLRIVNINEVPNGNDLGLDDISFAAAVPEPASWAMLIAGFGLVGMAKRRRVRSALA